MPKIIKLTESDIIRIVNLIKEQIEDDITDIDNIEYNNAIDELKSILIEYGHETEDLDDLDDSQLLMILGEIIDGMEPGSERNELEMVYYELGNLIFDESDIHDEPLYEDIYGSVHKTNFSSSDLLNEAEYQGRKVQLGKIMQGDIKKFKVYVKNDKGKVVKVNFGFGGKSAKGKRMPIRKRNPERRKSFRARHRCDNPGPRWKPRYWACRTW
jgi:hypothetical protein